MKLYTAKTPKLAKWLFPSLVWEFSVTEKKLFLTFDDGPIPEVTPWVLAQLATYNAKATFFCIGDNVEKHPAIFQQVVAAGHAIGNHTQQHLNGWKVSKETYIDNICEAQKSIENHLENAAEASKLFRPPYGKLTPQLCKRIQKLGYKIILWDVLSGDFDKKLSPEKSLSNVVNNAEAGSIVVFHDSLKAFEKLKYALPKVLQHFHELGYTFERILL
ncbi:peptidoglycan/xylan/chitin deacetylase (PgdA/CDA1 family) [Kordia periserrulae]|uniref:Peptidoglycan/xylan/chitin deacetylase (PgdA/CDA1 family) n=1 Tax=Kordia periserrulae TaxID=701523 RepID=A0A2T6C6C4_9FLAO|nr:polysaccharide deacetylase family protein [Kordia periserrulae]PTX63868.1 peptidoglycan/xylan/chitin deacetylase (PgdA/CDA1 family) [Kordia periserrulae]